MPATYSAATLRRCETILRNAKTQDTRKARAVQAAKQVDPNAWRKRKASESQLRRINGCERKLGYRLSTAKTIGNAGQASDLYQSLRAELRA
jgi:hypothetical protein